MSLGGFSNKIKFILFWLAFSKAVTSKMSLGSDQKVPRKYKPNLYRKVQKLPVLGGLHHHYLRSAA
jgi:hypothetical protein